MKTHLKISLSCVLALFWAGTVTGASLVHDGFDYLPSPLNGRNGGSGFAAPWVADPGVVVKSPALSTPLGQPSTGLALGGGGFNSARQLSTPLNLADYWASFEIRGVPGNDQVFLGLDLGPSPLPLVSFGRILNTYFIRQGSGPIVQGGVGSPPGFTDLLVARFHQIGPGTAVDLWVNPTDFTLPPLVSMVVPTVSYDFADMQVQPGFLADEVRIGTTSFDVSAVPEPASLELLALAAWALLWRRPLGTGVSQAVVTLRV